MLVEMLQQIILPKGHCRLEKVSVWKLGASDYGSRERGFMLHSVVFILNIAPGFIWVLGFFVWGVFFVCGFWFGFLKGMEFLKYTECFTRDLKMQLPSE